MFEFLQDHNSGTFGDYKTVTVLVKGTTGNLRSVIVLRREGFECTETGYSQSSNTGLGSAGYHDVGLSVFDGAHRLTDCIGARCACGGDSIAWTVEAILYGNMTGAFIADKLGN